MPACWCRPAGSHLRGRGTQARRLLPYVQEYTQDGHMLLAGIPTTVALAGAGVLTNTHKG